MKLDLTSLRDAVAALERSLSVANTDLGMPEIQKALAETLRAGVIQNYQVAYELCWKFMKRWLEENRGDASIDGVTMRELFRLAAESLLIADVDEWMRYHRARNETSHIYASEVADRVFGTAVDFLPAVKAFLVALEARND